MPGWNSGRVEPTYMIDARPGPVLQEVSDNVQHVPLVPRLGIVVVTVPAFLQSVSAVQARCLQHTGLRGGGVTLHKIRSPNFFPLYPSEALLTHSFLTAKQVFHEFFTIFYAILKFLRPEHAILCQIHILFYIKKH